MSEENSQKLADIVQAVLNLPEPPKEASLRNLGLDSMGMFQLIESLESEFGVRVEEDEVLPEHFESLNGLFAFLQRKLGTGV